MDAALSLTRPIIALGRYTNGARLAIFDGPRFVADYGNCLPGEVDATLAAMRSDLTKVTPLEPEVRPASITKLLRLLP